MKRILIYLGIVLFAALIWLLYIGWRTPPLSGQHGQLDTHLYLSDSARQPLVVAFGGGSGGNDWERNYLKDYRRQLLEHGFGVLAIGYFKAHQTPQSLDRISLNAIADTIMRIASRHPQVDTSRIILMGSSKGAELVLNLGSRFPQFKGVVALSGPHVSFPALTIAANTSSWQYNNEEVVYVPAPFRTLGPALRGDLYGAFSMMLEDSVAVQKAVIEVERINGPILLVSGKQDDQWPATAMSEHVMRRLRQHHFSNTYRHLAFDGGHMVPLDHFEEVVNFLADEFWK